MDKQLEAEKKSEIELAMHTWTQAMQDMLDSKFGKSKVGHLLILFDLGNFGKSVSWISNARHSNVIQLLEHLIKHLEDQQSNILKP